MPNTHRPTLVAGDTVTTDVVKEGLESAGFEEIYTAADAVSAWKQLEEHAIEIVFVERFTPRFDGLEFLHEIRANQEYAHLAIVLLSPKALSVKDESVARIAKVNGLLTGLFPASDAVRLIDRIFSGL